MEDNERHAAQGDERRVTRRGAIAAGAGIYAGSMLWAASSSAATSTPADLLVRLEHEIRSSTVEKQLKASLLTTTGRARADLKNGRNAAARTVLQNELLPALERNKGRHRLGVRQAKRWITETEQIIAKIPGLGTPKGGGGIYVFNCYNEPINRLSVAGGQAGTIPPWSAGDRGQFLYTPAGIRVPRARSKTPGQFAIGDNAVSIEWDSFTGTATINIPGGDSGVSLDDDLVLFVAVNQATLQSTRGFVLATFKINQT
jgi:hypothetical protein